jgi:hypothetical protein
VRRKKAMFGNKKYYKAKEKASKGEKERRRFFAIRDYYRKKRER